MPDLTFRGEDIYPHGLQSFSKGKTSASLDWKTCICSLNLHASSRRLERQTV